MSTASPQHFTIHRAPRLTIPARQNEGNLMQTGRHPRKLPKASVLCDCLRFRILGTPDTAVANFKCSTELACSFAANKLLFVSHHIYPDCSGAGALPRGHLCQHLIPYEICAENRINQLHDLTRGVPQRIPRSHRKQSPSICYRRGISTALVLLVGVPYENPRPLPLVYSLLVHHPMSR